MQRQDLGSLEVLAGVRSSLCSAGNGILYVSLCSCRWICTNSNIARLRIGHELCNAPNMHIEGPRPRALLELAGSSKRYQEAQETYNMRIYAVVAVRDPSCACL